MRTFILRLLFIFICCLCTFQQIGQSVIADTAPTISADHYILMESSTGRTLLEDKADEQVSVASITKVMTAIVALEYGNLADKVTISEEAIQTTGSSIYLEEGEKITLEDLLYGLMLRSGNDAAKVIAEHIGGSEEGFIYLMNETANYIGMTDSHFMNPHGLDEPEHYSSAHDIALLMRYAMDNEVFVEISQTESHTPANRTYPWVNKNKLLTGKYPYSTGGKTGFTKQAGRTLVSTATKDNLDLIVVTLNASDDWHDHIHLFDHGFSTYELVRLAKQGERSFRINDDTIKGTVQNDVVLPLSQQEQDNMHNKVQLFKRHQHGKIGQMAFSIDEETPLLEVPLFKASKDTDENESTWMQRVRRLFETTGSR